jgi:cyclophilin family peptidyl-prolyl cis-trans isomerase
LSQATAQRNPLLLAGFVLLLTLILGGAAYGLNQVTNPQPASTNTASVCTPAPAGHPKSNPTLTYTQAPPQTIDTSKTYIVTICTARGQIVIQMHPEVAPKTVNNFVFLANAGFYDGLKFHRVLNTGTFQLVQGGDPKGDGTGGPGYSLPDEGGKGPYTPGTVAMARSNAVSGSQFFIDVTDNSSLAQQPNVFNVFGEVTSDPAVVKKIQQGDVMYWVSVDVKAGPSPAASAPAASPAASPEASPAASPSAAAPAPSPS